MAKGGRYEVPHIDRWGEGTYPHLEKGETKKERKIKFENGRRKWKRPILTYFNPPKFGFGTTLNSNSMGRDTTGTPIFTTSTRTSCRLTRMAHSHVYSLPPIHPIPSLMGRLMGYNDQT